MVLLRAKRQRRVAYGGGRWCPVWACFGRVGYTCVRITGRGWSDSRVHVRPKRVSGVWGTRACESPGVAGVIRAGVSGAPRSGAGQGEELAELAPALQARVSGRRAAAAIGAMPALGARRALPAPLHRAPAQGTPAGADASSSRPKRMTRTLSRNLPHRAPGPRRHRLLIAMPMESQTLSNASLTLSPTTARKRHMGGGVSANTPAM